MIDHSIPARTDIWQLDQAAVLLCPPLSLSTAVANNQIMVDRGPEGCRVDPSAAMEQFAMLFHEVAKHTLVFLLPPSHGLQDQIYVSNLAIAPPHKPGVAVDSPATRRRGGDGP